ncbi:hypothetical protein GGS20DRAFT_537647 [Poronia punctata]|nr:hypothetical protein GGS20DRAFT_537647 [Poronia punctata]
MISQSAWSNTVGGQLNGGLFEALISPLGLFHCCALKRNVLPAYLFMMTSSGSLLWSWPGAGTSH